MSLTIAVASDFHCHPSARAHKSSYLLTDGSREPQNNHPVQALLQLIKAKDLKADLLVLPGDFTDKADYHGFVVGVFLAREIGNALKVPLVVSSLGNHDVDYTGQNGTNPWFLAKQLFLDMPLDSVDENRRFHTDGFATIERDNWRCLLINSVLHYNDAASAKRGLVTDAQLERLQTHLQSLEPKELQFSVFHHHPIPHEDMSLGAEDLMIGGERLLHILEASGYHLAIHGHKHHPRLRYSTSGAAAIPVFASGSLSAIINDILSRSARNTFHIIELLAADSSFPYVRGRILTWELSADRGWINSTYQSSGIPAETGFGCKKAPSDLADLIEVTLANEKFIEWNDLLAAIPDLRFVGVLGQRAIAASLNAKNIVFSPNNEEPSLVGRPKTI